ncbi:PadR family transcriptional regulator [Phyllobacterium phragmitis]|uniref:PadR family transcriptional regulator n=1 Tax=Phyllobacterium phragmitis TaxID=2670329 RepID=A0A2S9IMN8_9HYPH|nr:PadR family transcriptional regulator [Phyllobacterium phragmitis]PRD41786.1 PadR family transcriptional regulator [Phyllobacterium phragmitis]
MPNPRTNPNFMNGVPELLVLKLLAEREMYGYEVVQAVRRRTGETITLGEGVIYPVLHGLEREGALNSRRQTVNGRSRIYYSITAAGMRRLSDLTGSWTRLTMAIQDVVAGGKYVPTV